MARYIDADALNVKVDFSTGTRVVDMAIATIRAINEAPSADVVPKSEVERLEIEIEALKIANGKMYSANKAQEAEVERLEHLRAELSKMAADLQEQYAELAKRQLPSYCQVCSEEEAINIGREYGKTEVAREIFAEIEREIKNHGICYAQRKIAELKKKYTEDHHDSD